MGTAKRKNRLKQKEQRAEEGQAVASGAAIETNVNGGIANELVNERIAHLQLEGNGNVDNNDR